ncbi:MAG: serine/threonine-protein kinase [Acidobacteriota bacterium]|nr:serine/threonine-protein kinase [Acidobacteriota bacterium]
MSHDVTESLGPLPPRPGKDGKEPSPEEVRGLSLGRYLLLESLGQGGMGVVFSAFDPELDRKVAIKVLRGDLLQSEVARARLVREAKAIAQLAHPNLVRVYDASAVGDQFFLAMELIEGRTLAQWLAEKRRSWREVVRLFLDFGEGLYAVHQAGLVHRDVKPSNVMVTEDGRGVLVDFGLARLVDRAVEDSLSEDSAGTSEGSARLLAAPVTQQHGAVGTPAYMSPEQRRGEAADHRSDQFSFCACLYEALYGRAAFSVERPDRSGQEGDERASGARVPRWLHRVLQRGLAEEPGQRFASLADLLSALRRDPARRWRWAALAAGFLMILGAVAWSSYRFADPGQLCQGADAKLAAVWGESAQSELQSSLLASGSPMAESAWNFVQRSLGDYTERWRTSRIQACEATRLRGEQSEAMLDLQVACLDHRLLEVRAAVDVLGDLEAPDLGRVPAVLRLPALEGCSDLGALMALKAPPADPAIQQRVEVLREEVAELRARAQAGQLEEVIDRTPEVLAEIDQLGYEPLAAEARLELSRSKVFGGDLTGAREMMLEAVELALESRHDEVLANALIFLVINRRFAGDLEGVEHWSRLARAAVERRSRPDLEAGLEFALGMVANMKGERAAAIEHFQAFLEHPEGTLHSPYQAYHNIAIAYLGAGEPERAAEALETSLARQLEAGLELSPDRVLSLALLSQIRKRQGRYEESLEILERALAIGERAQLQDARLTKLRGELGDLLVTMGRAEDGVAPLETAMAAMNASEADPFDKALMQFALGRALYEAGEDVPRGLDLVRQALETLRSLGDRAAPQVARGEQWLAGREGP